MTTVSKLIIVAALLGYGAVPARAQDAAAAPTQPADGVGTDAGTFELGMYWGAFFPSPDHDLYEDSNAPRHRLEHASPDLGLRAGYAPSSLFGIEAELGIMPSQRRDNGAGVNIISARAHIMLLAPTRDVIPFMTVGGGLLAMSSEPRAYGSDIDGEVHVGVGAKAYIQDNVALRLDLRDTMHAGHGRDEVVQSPELLLGFVVVTGRQPPPAPPAAPAPAPLVDTDADGIDDATDACKGTVGVLPDGCPPPDADADGVLDAQDACPQIASGTNNGCPPPPDTDGDGVTDAADKCPAVAGTAADGCAAPEADAAK